MTTALRPGRARLEQRSGVVERAEDVNTFFLSTPAIGGTKALLPVAMISLSYGVTLPSSVVTTCVRVSMSVDAHAERGGGCRWTDTSRCR